MPLARRATGRTTAIPDSEEDRVRARKAAGYTNTDEDDLFLSKSPRPAHTPSKATRRASGKTSKEPPATKPSIKGAPVIELSSDDDEYNSPTPLRRLVRGTRPPKSKSNTTPVATPANDAVRKRKFIQSDSSSGEDFSHIVNLDSDSSPIRFGRDLSPPKRRAQAVEYIHTEAAEHGYDGDDGIIDYVPTPRRPLLLFPSGTNNSKAEAANEIETPTNPIRRRLTLEEVYPENEELSWESQVDAGGAVRSGAMLFRPSSPIEGGERWLGSSSHPSTCLTPPPKPRSKVLEAVVTKTKTVMIGPVETPSKRATRTPRAPTGTTATPSKKGKLPVEVARLHRVGLVFFKELDKKVFGGALGAQCLPDLSIGPPPMPETPKLKGRGRKPVDPNPIYNMGSIGHYLDGQGTISVIWSNRMQTTAGRTEYHRNHAGIVTLKIELGVKVLTDEERLRNTIAHEACHAASYVISGDFKTQHGATWKSWTEKVMRHYSDIHISTRHDYAIDYKFNWKCAAGCDQTYHRHSNSIDTTKSGCHCGSVLTPLFETPTKRMRTKKVENTLQCAANGIAKPPNSPVPLGTLEGLKGYPLPSSSPSVSHGRTGSSDDAHVELDDSLDEEIAKLTKTLSGVGI